MKTLESLRRSAARVRGNCIMMAFEGKSSHLSSALSCADLLTVLFGAVLRHPTEKNMKKRDRFFLSKGHAASALYAAMAEFSLIQKEELGTYCRTDSRLSNHPCRKMFPLLEFSSGSLGYGLGMASGMLTGCQLNNDFESRAFVLLGDGETNEGSVWEAVMFAAARKLKNLIAVVDHNNMQATARNDVLTGNTSLAEKFSSFGWTVISCNGNDIAQLLQVFSRLDTVENWPVAILADTTAGAGVRFMENDQVWFYRTPRENEVFQAFENLALPCKLGEYV